MILRLLVSSLTKFRLELMYVLLIVSIVPSFTHLRRFPAACAAAILHGNLVFCFYQQDKFFECEVKLRQTGNHCTRIIEAAKFAYVNKTEDYITSNYYITSQKTWHSGLLSWSSQQR